MDNKHTTFGLSRRNPGAWAAAALAVLSAAARILYYSFGGRQGLAAAAPFVRLYDPKAALLPPSNGWWIFLSIILPSLACLLFAVRIAVNGRDRLYKTGLPMLLGAVSLAFYSVWMYYYGYESSPVLRLVIRLVYCLASLVVWDLTANGARIKTKLPAILVFAVPFAVCLFVLDIPKWILSFDLFESLPEISLLLMLLSLTAASVSLEKITSEKFRPRRGDRPDGRLVRSLDPINGVAVYIMPDRNGACTYFRDSIECSRMEEYIRRKRDEGLTGFGTIHVLAAAYVRVISQYPACNRFISGQRTFSRDGELELAMVVKKNMTADAPETIINVYFSPEDTAEDVYRKFNEQVRMAKGGGLDSSFDHLAGLVNLIPGLVKKGFIWLMKTLDYFGLLPRWLMRLSPFHGSVFVTDLGSLGVPPVFHHLYDFGNIPVFIAFGARRSVNETGPDGKQTRRKYVDYTIVTDERICDGFYYASAFKAFRRCLNNPEKLDVPPEKVVEDIY